MLQFRLPNGDIVPVPQDVHGGPPAAVQGFYDGQAQRVAEELGIGTEELHSRAFSDKVEAAAAGVTAEAFRAAAEERKREFYDHQAWSQAQMAKGA